MLMLAIPQNIFVCKCTLMCLLVRAHTNKYVHVCESHVVLSDKDVATQPKQRDIRKIHKTNEAFRNEHS